jgi:putative transposase
MRCANCAPDWNDSACARCDPARVARGGAVGEAEHVAQLRRRTFWRPRDAVASSENHSSCGRPMRRVGERAHPCSDVRMGHGWQRVYDHRIREQIVRTGNPDLFPELDIPRRTALSWIRRGIREVVTLEDDEAWQPVHNVRIAKLEQRVAMLSAILRLVLALLRVSGFELGRARIPDAANKRHLLSAIERARRAMPLSAALRVLRLSSARYYAWVRADGACALDDRPSCPRSKVQRLTFNEVKAIGDIVQSTAHRHMSIRGLALHAQRIGQVFAHPATWSKLIRERGWRRPRLRLYPCKPKVGLRTRAPNEAWHLDVTIIKLLDGTKAYVHAVIDNFSRRILAWTVADHLDPMNTRDVLNTAATNLGASARAAVFMDSGVENLNGEVDTFFDGSVLRRIIAQIDVSFSSSLIEAWWRTLKHQWLYLHTLDNLATVRKLVGFYVTEHNQTIPHSAFQGQTPDEVYFERGTHVPDQLAARRRAARQQRVADNRSAACAACPRTAPVREKTVAA